MSSSKPPTHTAPREIIRRYHERTKHHYHRYARSLGNLDWANQPDPFRRYEGAELIEFPFTEDDQSGPSYDSLFEPGAIPSSPVCFETLGRLFELSLGLSAWKEFQGTRWALRINPSSGNLHPTEGYVVAPPMAAWGSEAVVAHYAPKEHGLEIRARFEEAVWNDLVAAFPAGSFLVGLTSIHWREAWKYGERAFRYCQHDVGHALAALRISAAALGWRTLLLDGIASAEIGRLLGVDREDGYRELEHETPDLLAVVFPGDAPPSSDATLPGGTIERIAHSNWFGHPNRLSAETLNWDAIQIAEEATEQIEATSPSRDPVDRFAPFQVNRPDKGIAASAIVRNRRSAVAMDGRCDLSFEEFCAMLERTLPTSEGTAPWDAFPSDPAVHLCLFVHRVENIPPGLYVFVRRPGAVKELRSAMKDEFVWEPPQNAPTDFPLYLLEEGDVRRVAGQVSCGQDIAAMGAFSLGMIAEFERTLDRLGAWGYKRLFWEAGAVGQILYLEAEAAGHRATGIGCYFDDPVHDLFGFRDTRFQSLYHFTIGDPVEDARLLTLAPYTEDRMKG